MHRSVDAAILIFVTSTMLSLGLRVPGRAIQQGIRDSRLLMVGTVVNLLLIPALASLVAATFGPKLRCPFGLRPHRAFAGSGVRDQAHRAGKGRNRFLRRLVHHP